MEKVPTTPQKPITSTAEVTSHSGTPDTRRVPATTSSLRTALTIVGSLLGVALLVLAFVGGYFVGQNSARAELERLSFNKRQLTENLDQPLSERPLLKNIPERIKQNLKDHGLRGTIVELEEDTLLVDAPSGARTVRLTENTRFFRGDDKTKASRKDLKVGQPVLILSKGENPPKPDTP